MRRRARELWDFSRHTSLGQWLGIDLRLVDALEQMIELETGINVALMPWHGLTLEVLVAHPSSKKMLQLKKDKVLFACDCLLQPGRIQYLKIKVAPDRMQ